MKLQNKVVLVTGASKGIGAAIAIEAAREGAQVIINYAHDRRGAEKTLSEVEKLGMKGLVVQADVGKKDKVDRMVSIIIERFGRIDGLINNAGIALWKPFLELDEDNWDRTISTNLKGAFLCTQTVSKFFVKERIRGSVVNISSIAAHGALDCLVPYCASKGGMTLMTKAIATELAPYGVRVNAVAPGTIDIKRNRNTDPNYPGSWEPYIPMGRVGLPSEIAKPVIFLVSDEASYVTGQTFWVDGGETSYVPMPRAEFARGK
jgi:NAD(P)-dependent dehydrogenase (short-subunit alcohol dehydrogenase family)